jgi:hypothetical protein
MRPPNQVAFRHGTRGLPSVIGVVAAAPDRLERLCTDLSAKVPLVPATTRAIKRLTRGEFPTEALIRDGKLLELWVKRFPARFTQDIRRNLLAAYGLARVSASQP